MGSRPPIDFDFDSIFLLLTDMHLDQKPMGEWEKEECQKFFERVYECAYPRRSLQPRTVASQGKGKTSKVHGGASVRKGKRKETYLNRMDT